MSEELDFYIVDDIPEYTFYIVDDEEQEQYIPIKGEDGSFKYEKVAELPTTGEDGVLYLVPKSHTEQTATGNPISINVTEGAGKLTDLQLNGDTAQTTYSGKNLFDYASASDTNNTTVSTYRIFEIQGLEPNTSYTLSGLTFSSTSDMTGKYAYLWAGNTFETRQPAVFIADGNAMNNTRPFTTDATGKQYLAIYPSDTTTWGQVLNFFKKCQIEKGSTATTYEQYVGGVPSPNPSYPQPIYNVTGTQTISINGTSYTINLGDIALAEIGAYQDYIYPSGTEWYIKKQVGKVTYDGTQDFSASNANNMFFRNDSTFARTANNDTVGALLSNNFTATTYNNTLYANVDYGVAVASGANRIAVRNKDCADKTAFLAWLTTHPTTVYYALATPTDTKITDTNLIAQLEAVRTAQLANGTNAISNTATGSNLAGDLELKYYEYNPTDKYTKWLWVNADAAYEQM